MVEFACFLFSQTLKTTLGQLKVSETSPTLFVFDSMMTLPQSEPLLQLMGNRHAHIVVLYKHYQPPDKLTREIDHQLVRGSKILPIDPLSMIHSTQRTVHTIQWEMDFAPDIEDQIILEKLAEFTSGSPVLVDITSQLILAQLKEGDGNFSLIEESWFQGSQVGGGQGDSSVKEAQPSHDNRVDLPQKPVASHSEVPHKAMGRFADSIALNLTRMDRELPASCVFRDISQHVVSTVPSMSNLTWELRDEWDTKCQYDSWDSISDLIRASNLKLEEEVLLNCLAIFGANPIPASVTTALSSLISRTSGQPHLAPSLLHNLKKMSYISTYPLPVVIHPSIREASAAREPDFVYMPQDIANFLWKTLDDCDKAIALATSYHALSTLPTQHSSHFLLGLVALLVDAYELNFDLMGKECYGEVYRLYFTKSAAAK